MEEIMVTYMGEVYLTEREAAKRYNYSVYWFQKKRYEQRGPRYKKVGMSRRVLYPLIETDEWFKNQINFII
jgi:antibiotic biosynthesis monooxygenase (ABM) superfamily enzyme